MSQIYLPILLLIHITTSEYIPPGPKFRCPTETDKKLLIHPCMCEKGTDIGLVISCRNAGLASMSVGISNIATLKWPIEKLTLQECPIAHLQGPLFHKSEIYSLSIENTPLEDIDEYFFYGVNKTLHYLSIVKSKLKTFPKEAFKVLGNLKILILDGHNILSIPNDIFSQSKLPNVLEKLHIVNGNIKELAVEPFGALKRLKTLDFHGNKIESLKKNQFKGMREAEVLDLSYNNIKKMDGSQLADLTKLGWFNVSNNQIPEITRGMFARNTVLKVLNMTSNKIKKLDTNSFRGMRFLRRLYLSDNVISDIGRGTFGSITRIGTIDLSKNLLKKIDYQMFYQLNYVEIIDVSQNNITIIEKQSFKDIYLAKIDFSNNNISVVEPGSFENCANITLLDFSNNNLSNISKNAFDINTYATEFQLSYNYFTELNQIPIQNMTGIKVLNVSHNNLHSIPRNTFPKLYELHTVDVSHNNISEIFSAVFQNLFSLRYLNLSHNSMESIKPATFGTLPTLLQLDLSYNQLSDVARGGLAKLASCSVIDISHNRLAKIFQLPISLGSLKLSHNEITSIPENTWPSMNALLRLDISNNRLSDSLAGHSFVNLLTLQRLDLSANGIEKTPWEALNVLASLQYLYLKDNKISKLERAAFGRLPTVFEVDLSGNRIEGLEKKSFDGLLQLLSLNLASNNITRIPNEAFKGLVSLRNLDLSNNNLERIDNKTHGLLDDCLSLEKVNLSFNQITYITDKMFPENRYIPYKLQTIDLSHNFLPVLTKQINFGTKKVKNLNLSHNSIEDIRKDVLVNLTSLEVLDLSNNQIKDLKFETGETNFKLPSNITQIILSGNKLKVLPVNEVAKANKLKLLNVIDNRLMTIDKKIVDRIQDGGLEIYFKGNPITCDCNLIPLKHYLNHVTPSDLSKDVKFHDVICHDPSFLQNKSIVEVNEDMFVCQNVDNDSFDFGIQPDVKFRRVDFSQREIYLQWHVLAAGDIANFQIYIRDSDNNVYFKEELAYNTREKNIEIEANFDLKTAIFDKNNQNKLELCIQTLTSDNKIRKWFQSQCYKLPENFEMLEKDIKRKRIGFAMRAKGTTPYRSSSPSNLLMLVSDSILLTFCIFLGAFFRGLCFLNL